MLRHTFGTELIRNGVSVFTVQKLMRHANLDTTAGYIEVSQAEQAEAVGRLPGAGSGGRPRLYVVR